MLFLQIQLLENALYLKIEGICLLKQSGHCRTHVVVLLSQQKFDVSFEIFLAFIFWWLFVCLITCFSLVFLLLYFFLFPGFLNLTQKTRGTNDLSIFFFMLLQLTCSHLKLQCLSIQWTQRNCQENTAYRKGAMIQRTEIFIICQQPGNQVNIGVSFLPCYVLLFLNEWNKS